MIFGLENCDSPAAGDSRRKARSGDPAADNHEVEVSHSSARLRIGKPCRLVVDVMINGAFTENLLLAGLAVTLIVAAAIDVRTFTISNRLNLGVALAAPLYWLSIALPLWPGVGLQVAAGVAVFAVFAGAFFAGMMGGGDVKLAAALALWFSPLSTIKFLVLTSIAGGVLTLGILAWHRARRREGRPEIPYGVAIAFGGLAILAQRFLNQFA